MRLFSLRYVVTDSGDYIADPEGMDNLSREIVVNGRMYLVRSSAIRAELRITWIRERLSVRQLCCS